MHHCPPCIDASHRVNRMAADIAPIVIGMRRWTAPEGTSGVRSQIGRCGYLCPPAIDAPHRDRRLVTCTRPISAGSHAVREIDASSAPDPGLERGHTNPPMVTETSTMGCWLVAEVPGLENFLASTWSSRQTCSQHERNHKGIATTLFPGRDDIGMVPKSSPWVPTPPPPMVKEISFLGRWSRSSSPWALYACATRSHRPIQPIQSPSPRGGPLRSRLHS